MQILNFAHPLTPAMLEQTAAFLSVPAEQMIERRLTVQIDRSQPITLEVAQIVDSLGFSSEDWQTQVFVVNLPGLAIAAGTLIAEIHGRTGYFPSVLSITPVPESMTPVFQVTEVIALQTVRELARERR
jgi:hypothetical protein